MALLLGEQSIRIQGLKGSKHCDLSATQSDAATPYPIRFLGGIILHLERPRV